MIKVKVFKYRKGKIISIGVDPLEPYDLPVSIFYNKTVIDPLLYAVTNTEIKNADNAIYVRENEVDAIINDVKNFYKKYGSYIGMDIKVNIIEVEDPHAGAVTIEKKVTVNKPPVPKIDVLKELGISPGLSTAIEEQPTKNHEKPKKRTIEIAQISEFEIPEV